MQIQPAGCHRRSHVAASMHQDGVVLFDTDRGELFAANRTGAEIWQGLEQRLSRDRIAQGLSERYGIAVEIAHADTTRFIAELEHRHLLLRRTA
jgi:hypothetical protein